MLDSVFFDTKKQGERKKWDSGTLTDPPSLPPTDLYKSWTLPPPTALQTSLGIFTGIQHKE